MDSISPLAKILAEANGIDWRNIPGSGDSGTIVEQDILNYLSRIMSGDEEPPATPVDEAPPGWTGQMPPMPVMGSAGLQALSAAGVESDITEFVAQHSDVKVEPVLNGVHAAPMMEAAPVAEMPRQLEVPAAAVLEEDVSSENEDFELEEAELDVPAVAAVAAVAAEELAPAPVSMPAVQMPEVQPAVSPVAAQADVAQPPAQPAAGFGLGGFLSRLYRKPAETAVPPVAAQATPQPAPVSAPTPEPLIGVAHTETPAEVVPAAVSMPTESLPIEVDAAETEVVELDQGQPAAEHVPAAVSSDLGSFVPDSAVPVVEAPSVAVPATPMPAPVAAPPVPAAPVLPAAQATPMPAAAFAGVSLRLNADVAALMTAQAQLSEALGQAVPLSLLVGRAAARSLGALGLPGGAGVTLADASGQALAADLSGDFRTSLGALSQRGGAAQGLLVLDAAELGLDELHLGERSLSVGRSEDGRAVLSLRGDMDARRGASFLHDVAALLETPIKLLF
ncbi:E3 binding domain-containing protein [Deinococcus sp. KNUC1210]|uniref:E3 binding domain-containing protein n=1 Tax=Deinococcus sp. KNUC1210 TaxID=2917691 RepID=UPI001EF0DFDA|nr:E3 binding domain-containing protein [Deinococcus sp. KNUC1210]ULH16498.1 E3 binding domain-containing protein [Deinococcus sp. KNUC1210]